MDFPFGDLITLVTRTPTGRDGDGNTTYSTVTTTLRGAFAPVGSVETVQGQDVVVTQPTVYLPAGTDVTAVDRVIVNAVTYDVDGTPAAYTNPFTGWQPGVVVKLKAVTG